MDEAGKTRTTAEIAARILKNARTFLITKMPFMCLPINKLRYVPLQEAECAMMTDGTSLYYSPERIVKFFLIGHTPLIARMILHSVLHCMFRHFRFPGKDQIWHTACDVTVESVIDSLGIKEFYPKSNREIELLFSANRDSLESAPLVDRILRTGLETDEKRAKTLRRISACYYSDDHQLWHNRAVTSKKKTAQAEQTNQEPEQKDDSAAGKKELSVVKQKTVQVCGQNVFAATEESALPEGDNCQLRNGIAPNQGGKGAKTCEEDNNWELISRQTLQLMEKFRGVFPGNTTAGLIQSIDAVNRVHYDFRTVLRRFASLSEVPEVDQEEFDLAWYTLGMELYGDMPLVEPLECRENRRLKDFVIVIDTSGSTSGDTVKRFVDLTYTILKSEELFSNQINIHIIQCDMEIQEHVKLTSRQSFEEYIDHFEVKGLGGTSFVPAFEFVETLRERNELPNLKGLIYFTDGYGDFPEEPTDYETIFAYIEDAYGRNNKLVPAWITKLFLTEEDLQEVG